MSRSVRDEINQCDGCRTNSPLRNGLHVNPQGTAFMACQKDRYRGQETPEPRCPACNGNDREAPCAYPSEGQRGCLRDARLQQQAAVTTSFSGGRR